MIHNRIPRLPGTGPAGLASADAAAEETLVPDERSGVTPAQMVERKVMSLLHDMRLPRGWRETSGPRGALCYTGAEDRTQFACQQNVAHGAKLGHAKCTTIVWSP